MNLNSNGTFGSKARRLTRRLSYIKAFAWMTSGKSSGNPSFIMILSSSGDIFENNL